MTNKNPYEIRLDVLQMAKDMLMHEQQLKVQHIQDKLSVSSLNDVNRTYIQSVTADVMNTTNYVSYNETDLLSKATALYNFVATDTRAPRFDSNKESK